MTTNETLWRSCQETMASIPDDAAGAGLKAVFRYFDGEDITPGMLPPLAYTAFCLIKPFMEQTLTEPTMVSSSPREERPSSQDSIAVSVTEAAELLGVSKPTIYGMIRRGELRPRKAGRRTLISYAELKDWGGGGVDGKQPELSDGARPDAG